MIRHRNHSSVYFSKKKILFLFVFGLFLQSLFSCTQNKNHESYIKYIEWKKSTLSADSAKKELAISKTKRDSLFYLLVYLDKQSKIRFEICLPEIKQAILLSKQLGTKSELASAYYFMSIYTDGVVPNKQYADSLTALANTTNDPISKILYCFVGVNLAAQANDNVDLLYWLLKAKQILEDEAPYTHDLQLILNAKICEKLVDVKAFDLLKDQLANVDTASLSNEIKSEFNNVFGNYYFSRKLPDSALIFIKRNELNSYNVRDWIQYYRMIDRPDKLWGLLRSDLKTFDRSKHFLGLQFNEIGNLLLERGRYDSAMFFFKEAIEEGKEKMEYLVQAQATNQLIKAQLAQGIFEEALSTIDKNIAFTKSYFYYDLLSEVYELKKKYFLLQKRPYEALEASENQKLYKVKFDSAKNPVLIQRVLLADNQQRLKKSLRILQAEESTKKWALTIIVILCLLVIVGLAWIALLRKDKLKHTSKLNNELQLANAELDKRVQIRTQELEERNKKLASYAFMNAHNLRAPVSSILGLVNLYKSKMLNQDERDTFVDQIDSQTQKLDAVVKEIQKSVE
jgi:tetratricopeptide (TPR) repeat protein